MGIAFVVKQKCRVLMAGQERQFLQCRFPQIGIQGGRQHRFQDLDVNQFRINRHTATCESLFPRPGRRMWPL